MTRAIRTSASAVWGQGRGCLAATGQPEELTKRVQTGECSEPTKEIQMLLTLFVVLLVMWLLGFFAFHFAGGLIHILLIIAVISLVLHLFRSRSMA